MLHNRDMLQFYYLCYYLISGGQLLLAARNGLILYTARRLWSVAALLTTLIAALNAVDLLLIYHVLHAPAWPADGVIMFQLFWFGLRNAFSMLYWALWLHYVRLTYQRCAHN